MMASSGPQDLVTKRVREATPPQDATHTQINTQLNTSSNVNSHTHTNTSTNTSLHTHTQQDLPLVPQSVKRVRVNNASQDNREWSNDPSRDVFSKMCEKASLMDDNEYEKDFSIICSSKNVKSEDTQPAPKRFYIHKLVLRLVSRPMNDEVQSCADKKLHLECSEAAAQIFVRYCYQGDIVFRELEPSNVFEVLIIAKRYTIRPLINICDKYLHNNRKTRCLALLAYAPQEEAKVYLEIAKKCFCALVRAPADVVHLPIHIFRDLMTDDRLMVDSERFVYNTVMGWIRANSTGAECAAELLKDCVKLERLLVEEGTKQVSIFKAEMEQFATKEVTQGLWLEAMSNFLSLQSAKWTDEVVDKMRPRCPFGFLQLKIQDFSPDDGTEWAGPSRIMFNGKQFRLKVAMKKIGGGIFTSGEVHILAKVEVLHDRNGPDRYQPGWPYSIDYRLHDLQTPPQSFELMRSSSPDWVTLGKLSQLKNHHHVNNGLMVVSARVQNK